MLLFPPWNVPAWRQVDDSIRGGSSSSSLKPLTPASPYRSDAEVLDSGVIFSGTLDTTTLGGAGFASQRYTYSPPLDLTSTKFRGIRLYLMTTQIRSAASADPPRSFTFTIATTPVVKRPDGRNESRVTWEAEFELPKLNASDDSWARIGALAVDLPFQYFVPTYRGRPANDDEEDDAGLLLDTEQVFRTETVHEVGIMCRSGFGKQQGQFCLAITKVEAIERGKMQSFVKGGLKRLFSS